jgi:hypothetical protein
MLDPGSCRSREGRDQLRRERARGIVRPICDSPAHKGEGSAPSERHCSASSRRGRAISSWRRAGLPRQSTHSAAAWLAVACAEMR